jgi:hypothetical protein
MIPSECFYCFATDGKKMHTIYHCFGILACDAHYAASVRDCNAYLHRERMVNIKDLPDFENLFTILDNGLYVPRTSGAIEDGWVLDRGEGDKRYILFDTEWTIPVVHVGKNLMKRISLSQLLIKENIDRLDSSFQDIVKQLVIALEKGVYAEDNAQHEALIIRENETSVKDIGQIYYVMVNDVLTRVLLTPK